MGSLVGRLAKIKKIIYRIGGWTFNDPHPLLAKSYYRFIEKFSAKWKDIIINNAESDRQQAIRLKIQPREKIITIYNGIDAGKLEFLPEERARKELFKKISNTGPRIQDTKLVGTVANFYPVKGLEYLIEAADLIKDNNIKFIIIGEGQERKKLENLIKKYGLENNFFLIGAIPEAYKYLKAFDIFVLSSVKEGFPWTILEAMAAGVPVIATAVGVMPEIIENKINGILVETRNPKQLSEAIKNLAENKGLREKTAENAKKIVIEKFNLKEMVKKYEDLFFVN